MCWKHVQLSSENKIVCSFDKTDHVTNRFIEEIGKRVCNGVEHCIKGSSYLPVFCHSLNDVSIQSAVGCLQFSSDKSQIFLSSGSRNFHHFQFTLLYFTIERSSKFIVRGKTVIAYFLFRIDMISEESSGRTNATYKFSPTTKHVALVALHESIEYCMKNMVSVTIQSVHCDTNNGK